MLDYLIRASAGQPVAVTAGPPPDLETLDMETVEAELLGPEDHAIIETHSQTLTPPPDAYVQALQSTRRQLRELQAEVEGLYLELQDAGTRDQDLQQRLLRQRAALSEIASGHALYGETTQDALTALATAACAALSLARVGVWLFEDNRRRLRGALRYERLNRRGDAAPDLFRSQLPVFFLTLESESVITARDAAGDARLRDWLAVLAETPPSSSLVAIVLRRGEEAVALCTFECTGPCRQWEPDEVNFLAGIAHLIAPRIAAPLLLAASEAAPAALPEVAAAPTVEEGMPFRALVEHAAGMLWTMDPEGRFVYVNPTAAEAYGWDPGQMAGRFVTEFTATGFAQLERLALRAVRDGQPKYSYLTEHLCADGKTMTLAVNLAPLRNEAGAVTGCVAVAADTSHAHKRVEEGAPDEQTHFRRLVEGSHELIFELDAIGCIVAVNPAVARVYGYTPEELRGEPIAKLADAAQNRSDLDRLSAVLDGAECTAYETRHRRKDGQPVRLLVVAEPQRDAEGRISGIIGAAIELIEVDAGAVW
jgi:PAS domain S-box-containing protein